jgi:hypothetical protein
VIHITTSCDLSYLPHTRPHRKILRVLEEHDRTRDLG